MLHRISSFIVRCRINIEKPSKYYSVVCDRCVEIPCHIQAHEPHQAFTIDPIPAISLAYQSIESVALASPYQRKNMKIYKLRLPSESVSHRSHRIIAWYATFSLCISIKKSLFVHSKWLLLLFVDWKWTNRRDSNELVKSFSHKARKKSHQKYSIQLHASEYVCKLRHKCQWHKYPPSF